MPSKKSESKRCRMYYILFVRTSYASLINYSFKSLLSLSTTNVMSPLFFRPFLPLDFPRIIKNHFPMWLWPPHASSSVFADMKEEKWGNKIFNIRKLGKLKRGSRRVDWIGLSCCWWKKEWEEGKLRNSSYTVKGKPHKYLKMISSKNFFLFSRLVFSCVLLKVRFFSIVWGTLNLVTEESVKEFPARKSNLHHKIIGLLLNTILTNSTPIIISCSLSNFLQTPTS